MGIPVRDLASLGIIADVDAYDLSLQALGMGVNVRAENGHIERGPIARRAGPLDRNPAHAWNWDDRNNTTRVHVVDDLGYVSEWTTTAQTPLSPASGWIASPTSGTITTTELSDVLYVNRDDREPWYRNKNSTEPYKLLSTYNSGRGGAQFDAGVRFKSLRATANVLIGINVTKNGLNYPTTIKWSDFSDQGTPPRNWDVNGVIYAANGEETQSSISGENTLSEMKGSLVDGEKLGNNLVLYSTREAWLMEYTGGLNVFNFRRLFASGVINTNCVVEKEGVHFVFGDDDIYRHDGNQVRQTLAQGRVRNFIFRNLVRAESNRCFTIHNKSLNEIMFCYVSQDRYCKFPYSVSGTNRGCNRAAVFNYSTNDGAGCWYMYDLPWVTDATFGPVTSGLTWATAVDRTWNSIGGSWTSQGDSQGNTLLIASNAFNPPGLDGTATQNSAMRTFAPPDSASSAAQIDTYANGPLYIEKIKIDLDELKAALRGYKLLSGIDIEGTIQASATPLYVTVGSSDHPSEETVWGTTQTFDSQYSKIDCRQTGRFLALKMSYDDLRPLKISGFDLDLTVTAAR